MIAFFLALCVLGIVGLVVWVVRRGSPGMLFATMLLCVGSLFGAVIADDYRDQHYISGRYALGLSDSSVVDLEYTVNIESLDDRGDFVNRLAVECSLAAQQAACNFSADDLGREKERVLKAFRAAFSEKLGGKCVIEKFDFTGVALAPRS